MVKESSAFHPRCTSKNMKYLKNSNRAAVIRALALNRAKNRTELASVLNLTRMAISNIANELIDEALIEEVSSGAADANLAPNGRPPRQLTITDWSIPAICINIRRYSVSCMLMDIKGNKKYHSTCPLPVDADNDSIMTILISLISDIIRRSSDIPVLGIGISSIGPLDIYKKKLLNPPDFRNIKNLDIGENLKNHFDLPVYIDNDMNCSALAELFFGTGSYRRDFVFLGFSSGVGAGIIMNEKIIHGFGGFAGEVGHISVNPFGPICPCGQNGCIELYTRGENILRNVGLKNFEELNTLLDSPDTPHFILSSISEYKRVMHSLLVAVANSYDPDIIILGDIDLTFIQRFIPEFEEYVNIHMLSQGYQHVRIVPSTLADSAPLYGAGSIVFQRVFDGEIALPNLQNQEG